MTLTFWGYYFFYTRDVFIISSRCPVCYDSLIILRIIDYSELPILGTFCDRLAFLVHLLENLPNRST